MPELTAARLRQLPWTRHAAPQHMPPMRGQRSPRGSRLCDLCGGRYAGDDLCDGGRACPRTWGFKRRGSLEWCSGCWVPLGFVALWDAEDERASASRSASLRPWAPPGAADYGAAAKARPAEAHSASCRARTRSAGPPPRPPPWGRQEPTGAQQPAAAGAEAGPPDLMAPPATPPPPPRPTIFSSAPGPGRPASWLNWIRERLEATVAGGEAAARAPGIADAAELPAVVLPTPAAADRRSAAPDTEERRRRIMAALIAADNTRFSSEWTTTAGQGSGATSHVGHTDLLPAFEARPAPEQLAAHRARGHQPFGGREFGPPPTVVQRAPAAAGGHTDPLPASAAAPATPGALADLSPLWLPSPPPVVGSSDSEEELVFKALWGSRSGAAAPAEAEDRLNNYSRAQELGADAPELATDLPPAPASAGEPASTTAPPEYRAQPIPELTDLCSGMGDDLNPESSMLFSEIGAEGDPESSGSGAPVPLRQEGPR